MTKGTERTGGQVVEIPVGQIRAGANDRTVFEAVGLAELAESIREHGLAQAITVRPIEGGYEVVAGERRFRAHELLGRATVPAIVRTLTDEQAATVMLLENVQRQDLDPLDEARAYQSRIDRFDLTVGQVATMAGVTIARVTTRLPLLRLIPDAQAMVRTGTLSINHARVMADLDGNRQVLALQALAKGIPYFVFRDLCVRLAEEQAAEPLFDTADFLRVDEYVLEAKQGRRGPRTVVRSLLELVDGALGTDALTEEERRTIDEAREWLDRTAA